jgi:hypothetical protein
MKKAQTFIAAFVFVIMGAFTFLPVSSAGAAALDSACTGNSDSALCQPAVKDKSSSQVVGAIVNTLLYVVGGLSVVMIIVGGLLYVTSQGDSGGITRAKNTILYAVIGLIVSFLAYAIVNWVLHLF